MKDKISFWSQTLSPVVTTETPARKRSIVILPVMPRPPAAFSPLTTIKSTPCCSLSSGSPAMTALRPGSPTTSPRKRTVSIEQDRIEEVQNVDVSLQKSAGGNDEIQMPNAELKTNHESQGMTFRRLGLVIPLAFARRAVASRRRVIRGSSFVAISVSIFATTLRSADNLGVLGSAPKWSVLEHYQETITHDEFAHLINDVYCTHGFAADLIKIDHNAAQILINRESHNVFTLRFAPDANSKAHVPRLWRPARSLLPAKPEKPPSGLRVALDPGHLGGKWAKMDERWFQVGDTNAGTEG